MVLYGLDGEPKPKAGAKLLSMNGKQYRDKDRKLVGRAIQATRCGGMAKWCKAGARGRIMTPRRDETADDVPLACGESHLD